SNLGDTVSGTGLPGGLDTGVGGLVSGLGDTVASVGGLLNADPDNPQPLTTVLGNATNAVGALTGGLAGEGGLLNPITGLVGGLTAGLGDVTTLPILEPTLGNTCTAVDNILPLGPNPPLGGVGITLDGIVSPVAGQVVSLTQQAGGATGLG